MDVLLVGPRGVRAAPASLAAALDSIAVAIARRGDRVRVLQPVERGHPSTQSASDGTGPIRRRLIVTRTPPFRSVIARLSDIALERAVNEELRDDPPDVLHMHGYGGANSYLVPWLADRLGVPAVVFADPIDAVLCHRGTRIDRDGKDCTIVDDAERCARCCRAGDAAALGVVGSALASLSRPLCGLSPFPHPNAMRSRNDLLVHGLASARAVGVRERASAEALVALGVPERLLEILPDAAEPQAWRALWQRVLT